ncbi:MAG: hypothetical protein L3K14_09985 [Thermoplasmata archaeon]|nr:hypothetical protein [Thermoplasmata archaeon]
MSGERLTSPPVHGSKDPPAVKTWALLVAATAVVTLLLLAGAGGPGVLARGLNPLLTVGIDRAVFPAFPPMMLSPVSANNTTVDVTVAFNLSVTATGGTNNASNYTYTWKGLPTGCVNDGLDPTSCTPTTAGSYSVTVTVNDTSANVHATSSPLVITVNPPPVVSVFAVSKTPAAVNSTIWFNATGASGTGPYTYRYTGLPIGCTGNTSSFSCVPSRAGVYNVTVSAIDLFGLASPLKNVTVTVTPAVKTTASSGIGTTGWAIVIGILVVGGLVTVALLFQARREERAGRMGREETPEGASGGSGGTPPTGGAMPPGPQR